MEFLTFGHGYTAAALTALLTQQGWRVTGTSRSELERVEDAGASALSWPGPNQPLQDAIARADAILVSVPPQSTGDPVLAEFGASLAKSSLKWLGYLSTTGVYGDRDGGWVDEDSTLMPTTARGRLRVDAEAQWTQLASKHSLPLHIFRLAGIYGPGRGPFAKLRNGAAQRIVKPNQVFSRIHVDDAASVLMASVSAPNPGRIYNLCDDAPAPPEDVIAFAANLLNLPEPPAVPIDDAELSQMARSFYSESKRVRNDRIKSELGVTLRYPNYRDGLQATLSAENDLRTATTLPSRTQHD